MDWTEKYRPRSLADLVGNGPAVAQLRQWAGAWASGRPPERRAVVLAGSPGTGKTSAALALANDMGWPVIELNASDARNADAIRRVATAGAVHQTFQPDGSFKRSGEGGLKLIVLDEADNLYERMDSESGGAGAELGDRGGKAQILETIRRTQQPIVLIVNDLYALTRGSGSALGSLALTIKFSKVHARSIPKALARICQQEGIRIDPQVLDDIATKAEGDLRAAVRDLESLCIGRTEVSVQDLHALGARDSTATVFDVVRHILKGTTAQRLRREALDVDATPEDLVLWVDENLPKEYKDPGDLARGYDRLSRADVFLGRTKRRQDYRMWSYAGDLATVGVMTAREHEYKGFTPFGFPQWLSKMSRSKAQRQARDLVAQRVGRQTHASRRKTRLEQMDAYRGLFQADLEFAVHQAFLLELTDEEVVLLLGDQATAKRVKEIRKAVEALQEAAGPREEELAFAPKRARSPAASAPAPVPAAADEDEDAPADDADEAEDADEDAPAAAPSSAGGDAPKRAAPSKGQARLF